MLHCRITIVKKCYLITYIRIVLVGGLTIEGRMLLYGLTIWKIMLFNIIRKVFVCRLTVEGTSAILIENKLLFAH